MKEIYRGVERNLYSYIKDQILYNDNGVFPNEELPSFEEMTKEYPPFRVKITYKKLKRKGLVTEKDGKWFVVDENAVKLLKEKEDNKETFSNEGISMIVTVAVFGLFIGAFVAYNAYSSQLVASVTKNIVDFGYVNEDNYYVYAQIDDSDTYEYLNDIPIRDTQVFYFQYETVQSYITYDVDRSGKKHNVKIYSTQRIN
jgi:DNA-binding transcriptional regulator YhcF (GntR family)